MANAQFKIAIVFLVAVGVATTIVRPRAFNHQLRAEMAGLQAELASKRASVVPANDSGVAPATPAPSEELLRLRGEVARLRTQQAELTHLRDENRRLRNSATGENQALSGEEFLAKNATQEGVKQTATGLQYKVLATGVGKTPKLTDVVRVHYHGTLIDGTVFDSSIDRGEAMKFPVNAVIPGWTEALQMMREGDKWQLFVPSKLAYGERKAGGKIAPNSTLLFEVELLEIEPAKEN